MKKKPHILHLIATEFVGGPEKQVLTHLRYVNQDRFRISVGSYLEGGRSNSFLKAAAGLSVETLALYQHIPFDPRLVLDLRQELSAREIDLLVTHGYKSNVVGYLAVAGRIPQAMYVRGWTSESRRVKFYQWLERRFLRRATLLVTVAQTKREDIRALGIPAERIRVIENAVEDIPLEPAGKPLREAYSFGADSLLLIAAGRLSPEKGHRVLIEALAKCRGQGQDVACVIFGEGPEESSLRRQILRSNLEENVILAGFNSGWKKHLQEADALVNPSYSEVMPNVVLESMVHRCPVIATRVGGVPELIPDASFGFTVSPGDSDALASAITQLASGTPGLDAMRASAYQRVLQHFTFESQAAKLQDLYDELLNPVARS